MEPYTLKEYIRPFTNINDYLKAITIIDSQYSILHKNQNDIAKVIQELIDPNIKLKELENYGES